MFLKINDGNRDWIVRALESAGAPRSLIMKIKRATGRIFLTVQEYSAVDVALNRARRVARSREKAAVTVEKARKRRMSAAQSDTAVSVKRVEEDFEMSL